MIKPIGFYVLVKPDDVKESTDWGFQLNPDQREKVVITEGTIVSLAEGAWTDKPEGSYPKVGDRVIFAKYAGNEITDEDTGQEYRLMLDEDIRAIIVEDSQ